jgi:uncharacterized membrane protein YphA (DoxX/SURF4 family)
MTNHHLRRAYQTLKIVFGIVPILAGLDKFANVLTTWSKYLNPAVARVVPPELFMRVVGVVEIVAGVLVLSKLERLGSYLVAAWLLCIVVNLLTMGQYLDVAVRDFVMACGAFALAELTQTEGAHAEAGKEVSSVRSAPT